jgi:hypothetical protein
MQIIWLTTWTFKFTFFIKKRKIEIRQKLAFHKLKKGIKVTSLSQRKE